MGIKIVRLFSNWLAIATIASSAASHSFAATTPPTQDPQRNLTVLILGDSLALCGFGKRLDERFREDPRVKATFTYITCATQPLSWLKEKPYTTVQTHCGFWSIESTPGSSAIKDSPDVYGMTRGHKPKSHPVPKLEDLMTKVQPDILIMQTGGNLFGLFSGREKVKSGHDAATLRKYLVPFVEKAIAPPSKLRKIYWVAPPTSGRVSNEIQDFVFEQTRQDIGGIVNVIDSRRLVSYPYKHMEPDKEHFIGEDMNTWAENVYGTIDRDLSAQPWANLKPLSGSLASAASATPMPLASPSVIPRAVAVEPAKGGTLVVNARLAFKSKPIHRRELLPYHEFLVGLIYDVKEVIAGEYEDKQILVMHPAYIGLHKQSLFRYHVGRSYKLELRELEGSIWNTVKSKDDSGRIDLQPYIRFEDEARYPDNAR
ncbi:MAG: hypothetical protein ABI925_01340 [Verrucomicrobiota bacterium]